MDNVYRRKNSIIYLQDEQIIEFNMLTCKSKILIRNKEFNHFKMTSCGKYFTCKIKLDSTWYIYSYCDKIIFVDQLFAFNLKMIVFENTLYVLFNIGNEWQIIEYENNCHKKLSTGKELFKYRIYDSRCSKRGFEFVIHNYIRKELCFAFVDLYFNLEIRKLKYWGNACYASLFWIIKSKIILYRSCFLPVIYDINSGDAYEIQHYGQVLYYGKADSMYIYGTNTIHVYKNMKYQGAIPISNFIVDPKTGLILSESILYKIVGTKLIQYKYGLDYYNDVNYIPKQVKLIMDLVLHLDSMLFHILPYEMILELYQQLLLMSSKAQQL